MKEDRRHHTQVTLDIGKHLKEKVEKELKNSIELLFEVQRKDEALIGGFYCAACVSVAGLEATHAFLELFNSGKKVSILETAMFVAVSEERNGELSHGEIWDEVQRRISKMK